MDIKTFVADLQRQEILPSGEYGCVFRQQPASYIWQITLGGGYFIKQITVRHGCGDTAKDNLLDQYQREYDALKKLAPSFSDSDEFFIPEIVYSDPDKLLFVTKALAGESLQVICNQYARRRGKPENNALNACYHVGRFLKTLHQSIENQYGLENVEQLLVYIKERLDGSNFTPPESARIDAFLLSCEKAVVQNLGRYSINYVHHDLNPTNILVDTGKISVLDFADAVMDSPYQDLVYFPLMLKGQLGNFLKYRPSATRELLGRFYDGYGCQLSVLEEDPLYQLYVLKNLAIFMKTYVQLKEQSLEVGLSQVKNRLVLDVDLRNTRRTILSMVA